MLNYRNISSMHTTFLDVFLSLKSRTASCNDSYLFALTNIKSRQDIVEVELFSVNNAEDAIKGINQ
jgi:hypothetical protein